VTATVLILVAGIYRRRVSGIWRLNQPPNYWLIASLAYDFSLAYNITQIRSSDHSSLQCCSCIDIVYVKEVDELQLESFRYGGVTVTGFSATDREKTATYLRDVKSSWHRFLTGPHTTTKHPYFNVCTPALIGRFVSRLRLQILLDLLLHLLHLHRVLIISLRLPGLLSLHIHGVAKKYPDENFNF